MASEWADRRRNTPILKGPHRQGSCVTLSASPSASSPSILLGLLQPSSNSPLIYEDRAFDMPILGDALEDAGCTNAAILKHCRSGAEHVRGCWCLDLILGKE